MATSINSTTSQSTDAHSFIPSAQTISIVPVHHLVTIKLTLDNYLFRYTQIVTIFKGQRLYGYFVGSYPCPPPTSDDRPPDLLNTSFLSWQMHDHLILSGLTSYLLENVLAHVVRCKLSDDV